MVSDATKGVLTMGSAATIWGLSAIYYKLVAHVPPLEILGHRTLWSLVFFGLVLIATGRLPEVTKALSNRRVLLTMATASLLISVNWFTFIFSIQIGRAVESSLGYFVFPLVSVGLGYVVLRERHGRRQWIAVALAVTAVIVLTAGLGVAPWVAIILGCTFGAYGLLKKQLPVRPVVSVTCEVLLMSPLAILWLFGVHQLGWSGVSGRQGGFFGANVADSLILIFSGPLTAGPLILMSYATKRLTLASVGLVQYINPMLQFLVAVFLFRELFTQWHGIAFGLIWVGLALYTWESITQEKSARKAEVKSSTDV